MALKVKLVIWADSDNIIKTRIILFYNWNPSQLFSYSAG